MANIAGGIGLRAALAAIALAGVARSASAADASGHSALALGAIVGGNSATLPANQKAALAKLLDGKTVPSKGKITVTADAVVCHAGDVDIASFGCDLTFGSKKVTLSGRKANELFATLIEAGVPGDGAAGTIYEAVHALSCVIDPAAIAQNDGSGATCSFQPGPP
jgi:hypothetical protein